MEAFMHSHLEERLQQDKDRISQKVAEMGQLVESAVASSLQAILEGNRQLAYSIILRDKLIDQREIELDRLCQEFLVRQQPVASLLRFVYGVIKINNELERIGDYAESIARYYLNISDLEPQPPVKQIEKIARVSIPMLQGALQAFSKNDCKLASEAMKNEDLADELRHAAHEDYTRMHHEGKFPSEAFLPMMMIASRFERVADQACNICEEILYICTGEEVKHEEQKNVRVLFVDKRDACRGQIAEAIGKSLNLPDFEFYSAGITPKTIDEYTINFLEKKGFDISGQKSKALNEIIDYENFEVIVALSKAAEAAFPAQPSKTIRLRWEIKDPSKLKGSKKEIKEAYEKTYQTIKNHLQNLVHAAQDYEIKEDI